MTLMALVPRVWRLVVLQREGHTGGPAMRDYYAGGAGLPPRRQVN